MIKYKSSAVYDKSGNGYIVRMERLKDNVYFVSLEAMDFKYKHGGKRRGFTKASNLFSDIFNTIVSLENVKELDAKITKIFQENT